MTLAAKGYNVTSLTADDDKTIIPNLHYLHLDVVHDLFYNNDKKINRFGMGEMSPWEVAGMIRELTEATCEGSVRSIGWKQLHRYPHNFKV